MTGGGGRAGAERARLEGFFRSGVGLLVLDPRGRALALERRKPAGAWQLPQGGIEPGEDAAAAAWRELREETGLTEGDVDLVREAPAWLGYELPPALRSAKTGRGQVQRWFLFRLRPGAPAPRPDLHEAARLDWRPLAELARETAEFRRPVYEALLREFEGELRDAGG